MGLDSDEFLHVCIAFRGSKSVNDLIINISVLHFGTSHLHEVDHFVPVLSNGSNTNNIHIVLRVISTQERSDGLAKKILETKTVMINKINYLFNHRRTLIKLSLAHKRPHLRCIPSLRKLQGARNTIQTTKKNSDSLRPHLCFLVDEESFFKQFVLQTL